MKSKKSTTKSESYLARIMRPHAKPEAVQKRQSALLMEFAEKNPKHVAQMLQKWLQEPEARSPRK